ncbi:dinitrogenase iron-molybdenum cofactor biosynthesis protein [Rhodocyclus tenuis]|uniref:Dinitrogenase iron-molybdenum cofactor biosynthesis protein n=1 Tax=Rhodocyclus gracilis TaxID=2929842 RepID=A0ABX0WGH0_9RHOO|nr:dinitrogenase iron-molybdenum cofactor N-terminal domain-containing protein [Rhodocyclus gracilis]NJA88386.1 dinitrogenase iron-molybdenum cofactor biosynthesis protein [Rhodocyclus gracilis]
MNRPLLPPALALRIGLAARALPGDGLRRLMPVLVEVLGLPLTERKLKELSFARLRSAGNGEFASTPRAILLRALGYLRGEIEPRIVDAPPPMPQPYRHGDMPGSLRVAVVCRSGERIDGSFSTARSLLIYQVSRQEIRLIDHRPVAANGGTAGDTPRDAARLAVLGDCQLLYARTLSNRSSASLMRAGIHPVATPEGGEARARLAELQEILRGQPAPWLLRAMGEGPRAAPEQPTRLNAAVAGSSPAAPACAASAESATSSALARQPALA